MLGFNSPLGLIKQERNVLKFWSRILTPDAKSALNGIVVAAYLS